jgi:hypothetical protein
VWDDARQVGVDDQYDTLVEPRKRRRHRGSLAAARVHDRLRAELRRQRPARFVIADDQGAAGHRRGSEHVGEHRECELRAHALRGVEPSLAVLAAEGDHDLRHRARL